jgi:hypothetical protein
MDQPLCNRGPYRTARPGRTQGGGRRSCPKLGALVQPLVSTINTALLIPQEHQIRTPRNAELVRLVRARPATMRNHLPFWTVSTQRLVRCSGGLLHANQTASSPCLKVLRCAVTSCQSTRHKVVSYWTLRKSFPFSLDS